MNSNSFFLKGDICRSVSPQSLETAANSFILCLEGKAAGIYSAIPPQHVQLPVRDHTGKLIIPGLTDLHTHASQFSYRALGMDMELLEWLSKMTFPEEAKYGDIGYAREAYAHFVEQAKRGPNTRLCVYATVHVEATLCLMDMLEESGLVCFVGKVNMDRNCPDYLKEKDSAGATREWLDACLRGKKEGRYKNSSPILTPRFIPSCTDGLMKSLAAIQKEYGLPLQSHLSENRREVEWVKELCPESDSYAAAYAEAGLLGKGVPTVMAHCVWPEEDEIRLLAERNVCIAHCPQSNTNLSSGIAPVRRLMERGVRLGLGSDIAGGAHSSVFRAMCDAIQASKLRASLMDQNEKALTLEEAFYLGTAGSGSFFGKFGSFEIGSDFDALIIDDSGTGESGTGSHGNSLATPRRLTLRDRLERVVYLSDDRHICGKYVRGRSIF